MDNFGSWQPHYGDTHLEEYENIQFEYVGNYKIEYRINILQLSQDDINQFEVKKEMRFWIDGHGIPYFIDKYYKRYYSSEEIDFDMDNISEDLSYKLNKSNLTTEINLLEARWNFANSLYWATD